MPSGDDVVARAMEHIGEKYELGSSADYNDAAFAGPWDCAEFASWCLFQVSGIEFGLRRDNGVRNAYTGYWYTDAFHRNSDIRIDDAIEIPGAFLLRKPVFDGDVLKRTGHIAISQGNGQTIEAMDSKHDVAEGRAANRTWDTGVLVPGLEYTRRATPSLFAARTEAIRAMQPPAHSRQIEQVVQRLAELGYYDQPKSNAFTTTVAEALGSFQKARGIVVDWELGTASLRALKIGSPAVSRSGRAKKAPRRPK